MRKRTWKTRGRKIPAAAIPKSIARVRRQRIVVYNTMQECEHTCLEPDFPLCTTAFRIAILRNSELQSLFGDNVKIVKMQGSIYIDPLMQAPYGGLDSNCATGIFGDPDAWVPVMNLYAKTIWQFRAGLCKVYSSTLDVGGSPTPDYDVSKSFDWSEPAFMRRWEKLWFFREELGMEHPMEGAFLYGYGDVSKPNTGALLNPLAGGTGNINTETGAITTAPVSVFRSSNAGFPQAGFRYLRQPAPYRLSLNSSRVINLKENEGLEIQAAFSTLFPGADCFPGEADACNLDCNALPCLIRIVPNLILTLQYG